MRLFDCRLLACRFADRRLLLCLCLPVSPRSPEKVNAGREQSNGNMRRIGQNGQPAAIKFAEGSRKTFGEW